MALNSNFYDNLEYDFEFKLLWQPWVWLWIQTFMTTLSMALNSNFYDNLEYGFKFKLLWQPWVWLWTEGMVMIGVCHDNYEFALWVFSKM